MYCAHCGNALSPQALSCPKCGHPTAGVTTRLTPERKKSKVATVILALLFGSLGLHRFYLRDYVIGVCYLVSTLLLAFNAPDAVGVIGLIALVDMVILMFRSQEFYVKKAAQ